MDEVAEKKKPSEEVLMQAHLRTQSRGERLFDWITYGGIAGIAVYVGTIYLTFKARYGQGALANIYQWSVEKLQKLRLSKPAAEDVVMVTTLMQAGNIAVLPVKLMEDNKPQIAGKFNEMLGEPSDIEDIKKEPKQTWGSLIKARVFLAWTPVFLSFRAAGMLFKQTFDRFEHEFAKYVVCHPLNKQTHTGLPPGIEPGMPQAVAHETKAYRVGKIAALDLFATIAAAALLYVGSRIFAAMNLKKHKEEMQPKEKLPDPPVVMAPEAPEARRHAEKLPTPSSYTEKALERPAQDATPSLSA